MGGSHSTPKNLDWPGGLANSTEKHPRLLIEAKTFCFQNFLSQLQMPSLPHHQHHHMHTNTDFQQFKTLEDWNNGDYWWLNIPIVFCLYSSSWRMNFWPCRRNSRGRRTSLTSTRRPWRTLRRNWSCQRRRLLMWVQPRPKDKKRRKKTLYLHYKEADRFLGLACGYHRHLVRVTRDNTTILFESR